MRMFLTFLSLLGAVLALSPTPAAEVADDAGAFFNGKDLNEWEGLKEYWSLKDGALVGATPQGLKHNTFLCSKKKYRDFELRFKVRLKDGQGNSGVQIRSEVVERENFQCRGPQADIALGYWASLYGEEMKLPGGFLHKAPEDVVKKALKPADFNDYSIKAVGKHCTIKLNGETTVDGDFPQMAEEGVIAWQLHAGGPMEVTFKDIHFKDLSKK